MAEVFHTDACSKVKQRSSFKICLIGLISLVSTLTIFLIIYFSAWREHSLLARYDSNSPVKEISYAAVVSDAPGCAQYGRKILQEKNGTAMDAAIATMLCMGVVVPESMGLGGGCMMVFYNRTSNQSTIIDGREKAPGAATNDMYKDNADGSKWGAKSIAVPGELAAYMEAHRKFGRVQWKDLFDGAIEVSSKGFLLHDHLVKATQKFADKIKKTKLGQTVLTNNKTGEFWQVGDLFRRPDLVETFKRLAENPNQFYNGDMMETFVSEIRAAGGILTEQDFKSYRPQVLPARVIKLSNGLTLHTVDPPGSGLILGFILNVVLKLGQVEQKTYSSDEAINYYHKYIEAFKFAYAIRSQLEDRSFGQIEEWIKKLVDDEFAQLIASKINLDKTFEPEYYTNGVKAEIVNNHGTSHLSVVDAEGNVVSATSTINLYWGSHIMSESTGIVWNDEMDDFSSSMVINAFGVPPGNFNLIEPGKRPLSSMAPVVVTNSSTGEFLLSIGAAGGTRITTAVALTLSRILFIGDDIKTALDAPRLHHQLYPNTIQYEDEFPTRILQGLKAKGHQLTKERVRAAVVNGIFRDKNGRLITTFDYRKGGSIDGY